MIEFLQTDTNKYLYNWELYNDYNNFVVKAFNLV